MGKESTKEIYTWALIGKIAVAAVIILAIESNRNK
jgi:hypothetical protein